MSRFAVQTGKFCCSPATLVRDGSAEDEKSFIFGLHAMYDYANSDADRQLGYSISRRIRTWDRFLGQRRWKLSDFIISDMHSIETVILMYL